MTSSPIPTTARSTLAEIIRSGRGDRSQLEIGAYLGVNQATVSLWEAGETIPRPAKARRLATVLGVEFDKLNRLIAEASEEAVAA